MHSSPKPDCSLRLNGVLADSRTACYPSMGCAHGLSDMPCPASGFEPFLPRQQDMNTSALPCRPVPALSGASQAHCRSHSDQQQGGAPAAVPGDAAAPAADLTGCCAGVLCLRAAPQAGAAGQVAAAPCGVLPPTAGEATCARGQQTAEHSGGQYRCEAGASIRILH